MKNSKLFSIAILSILFLFSTQVFGQKISEYKPLDPSTLDSKEFGGKRAIGFNIFGDGLGFVLRGNLKNEDQIGVNLSIFGDGTVNQNTNSIENSSLGVSLLPEYNFYLGNTYKEKYKRSEVKRKYKKHYLSLKAGGRFSFRSSITGVIAWHRETFRLKNKSHSRGLDLGIRYNLFPNGDGGSELNRSATIGIYFRLDWTWARK